MALLSTFVGRGDVVLDVGAHLGIYAYRMSRLVGQAGRVVCFEPQPSLADYLEAASVRLGNVVVRRIALSDGTGQQVLSLPMESSGRVNRGQATLEHCQGAARTLSVPATRLDDLELPPGRVTFLKIDVEGHELRVLGGAERLLRRHRPVLLVEIERRHAGELADATFDFLRDHAYAALHLDGTATLRPLLDGGVLSTRPSNDPASLAYTNNFLFVPVSRLR